MPPTSSLSKPAVFLVFAGLFVLFFYRLADRDLWSSHEARAAMDAQTVLDGGDWAVPHLYDGRAELQKPPLYYWLVAGIAQLRGGEVDAWAVRLPAAVAALGCVGVLSLLGYLRGRPLVGLLAGTLLATAVHFTWLRIGRTDMPLTLAVAVAVAAFHLANGHCRDLFLFVGYVAVAAGVLLKGPIGFVLPAAVVGLNAVIDGILNRKLFAMPQAAVRGLWWGIPLIVALVVPLFLLVNHYTNGEFYRVFVWEHNVERGLGGGRLRGHPFWLYVPLFAGDFLPWTPFVFVALFFAWKYRVFRTDPEARLGLVWFVAVLVVLSCARYKRSDYLLPAYPGMALFLACVGGRLEQHWKVWANRSRRFPVAVLPAAVCAVMVGFWFARVEWSLPAEEPMRDYRAFAAEVRRHAPRPGPVVFFRTEAHTLAFRVGRPLDVLVQWSELNARLNQPGTHYVVMPLKVAEDVAANLHGVRLEEVSRNTTLAGGGHERPLVLFRAEALQTVVSNP